jgi:hypothetical protein
MVASEGALHVSWLLPTVESILLLVADLIRGIGVTNSAGELLVPGAIPWLGNNLAFGLFYWLMDGGGPLARSEETAPVDGLVAT